MKITIECKNAKELSDMLKKLEDAGIDLNTVEVVLGDASIKTVSIPYVQPYPPLPDDFAYPKTNDPWNPWRPIFTSVTYTPPPDGYVVYYESDGRKYLEPLAGRTLA